ncbi:MAG: hypothetical protein EA412_09245 [Chitinophagaceae bacterium]|nr:MAG: hypothetical protein EA412_09245 [Chitinophagaceae bacterium]
MDLKQQAKDQIEKRLKKVEGFIADQGIGSNYLDKAKTIQRNLNLTLLAVSVVTIAGVVIWTLNSSNKDD